MTVFDNKAYTQLVNLNIIDELRIKGEPLETLQGDPGPPGEPGAGAVEGITSITSHHQVVEGDNFIYAYALNHTPLIQLIDSEDAPQRAIVVKNDFRSTYGTKVIANNTIGDHIDGNNVYDLEAGMSVMLFPVAGGWTAFMTQHPQSDGGRETITQVTESYDVVETDNIVVIRTATNSMVITLPSADGANRNLIIKNSPYSTKRVSIVGASGQKIEDSPTYWVDPGMSIMLFPITGAWLTAITN